MADTDPAASHPPEDTDSTKQSQPQVLGSLRERVSTFKDDVSGRVAKKASELKTQIKQRVRASMRRKKKVQHEKAEEKQEEREEDPDVTTNKEDEEG